MIEDVLVTFGPILGTIAAVMVFAKALLKNAVPLLAKKVKLLPSDESEIKAAFIGVAVLIGVALAFTMYHQVSYFGLFDMVPIDKEVVWMDHLIVGVLAGLGEKAIVDGYSGGKKLFTTLRDIGAKIPISSAAK